MFVYFSSPSTYIADRKDDTGNTMSVVDNRYEHLDNILDKNPKDVRNGSGKIIIDNDIDSKTGTGSPSDINKDKFSDKSLKTNNDFIPPTIVSNTNMPSSFKVFLQNSECKNIKNKYFCFLNQPNMTDATISISNTDKTFNYYISSPTHDSELVETMSGVDMIKSVKIKKINDITNVTINVKNGTDIVEQKIVDINKTQDTLLISSITLVTEKFKITKTLEDLLNSNEITLKTLIGKNYIHIGTLGNTTQISCTINNNPINQDNGYFVVDIKDTKDFKDLVIKLSNTNISKTYKLTLMPSDIVVIGDTDNTLATATLNTPYQGMIRTYKNNNTKIKFEILSELPTNMITEQMNDTMVIKSDKIDNKVNLKLNVRTDENNIKGSGHIDMVIPVYQNIMIGTEMFKKEGTVTVEPFPKGTEIVLKQMKDNKIVGMYGSETTDCTKGLCRILLVNKSPSVVFNKFPIDISTSAEIEIYIPGVGSKNFTYSQGALLPK